MEAKRTKTRAEFVENKILSLRGHTPGDDTLTTLAQEEAAVINFCKTIETQINTLVNCIRDVNNKDRWDKARTVGHTVADPAEGRHLFEQLEFMTNHLLAMRTSIMKCHQMEMDINRLTGISLVRTQTV